MSAETLRETAALMRERANSAGLAPWHAEDERVANRSTYAKAIDARNAEHIASWHPAVALAVADWLESVRFETEFAEDGRSIVRHVSTMRERDHALAVARAYLGEDA